MFTPNAKSVMLIFFCLLCAAAPLAAHDAFYPHHREDFDSLTRRRELRGTVLLITSGFLGLLATLVYFGLRKSSTVDDEPAQTPPARLTASANEAARAAQRILNANGTVTEAMERALATYAQASGVVWKTGSGVQGNTIRCKIGADVVTLNIDSQFVRLKAEQENASASVTLKVEPTEGE